MSARRQPSEPVPPTERIHSMTPYVGGWRNRLRRAIEASGKKHAAVAWDAGVDPTTLSRILNGHLHPKVETVVRLARAAGETVGWLFNERGYQFSAAERAQLRDAASTILRTTT
jgi:transcriptional regulator with XRE-family HTH domain